jgi:hypothetical protein
MKGAAVLCVERRLSGDGRVYTDASNKAGILTTRDARVAFAFTGLAADREIRYQPNVLPPGMPPLPPYVGVPASAVFRTGVWLVDALLQAGSESGGTFYKTFDCLRDLADHQWQRLKVDRGDRGIVIVMSGYCYEAGEPNLVFGLLRYDPNSRHPGFEGTAGPTDNLGYALPFGATETVDSSVHEELIHAGAADTPPGKIVKLSVDLIRRAAQHPSGIVVGEDCSSIIIPADPALGHLARFHAANSTSREYFPSEVNVAGDAPWATLDSFFDLPAR